MLRHLRLRNFRCFDDHRVDFSPTTLIVGKNNAGKTTIAEALRLVAIVTERYRHLAFRRPPRTLRVPSQRLGIQPSLRNLEIEYRTLCYLYRDPPAIVQADFENGSRTTIYLSPREEVHVTFSMSEDTYATSKNDLRWLHLPRVEIMPQVAPLEHLETILRSDYVRAAMSSYLSPRHFRNQLNLHPHLLAALQEAAADTWPSVQVRDLIGSGEPHGAELHLQIRDRDFVGEIGAMGHGLQMWVQVIWFLVRSAGADTVILDEPDVFMHADLQRKLIRHIRGKFPQVVITTHSTEMMSEVSPREIVLIDRRKEESKPLTSLPAVQSIISSFGSIHNIALTRLWGARRLLLVEGDDLYYLRIFQDTLFPESNMPIDALPSMEIGGWGGWSIALGSAAFLTNAIEEQITVYCILDSDYHIAEELQDRFEEAGRKGIQLHVWERKEIENYLLDPSAIWRVVGASLAQSSRAPSIRQVELRLAELSESLAEEAFDAVAASVLARHPRLGAGGANKKSRALIKEREAQVGGRLMLVSGKKIIAGLAAWAQKLGGSLSAGALARALTSTEIPVEVRRVITAIEDRRPFGGS